MSPHITHAINLFITLIIGATVILSPLLLAATLDSKGYIKLSIAVVAIWLLSLLFFDIYMFTG